MENSTIENGDILRIKNIQIFNDYFYQRSTLDIINSLQTLAKKTVKYNQHPHYMKAIHFFLNLFDSLEKGFFNEHLELLKKTFDQGFFFKPEYYELHIAQFCGVLLINKAYSLLEYFLTYNPQEKYPAFSQIQELFKVIPLEPNEDKFDCNSFVHYILDFDSLNIWNLDEEFKNNKKS